MQCQAASGLGKLEWTMQGDPKVIDYLNKGLRSELTAINQYWLHYRLLQNWGYNDLAKKWRQESIDEEHHIDFLETQLDLVEKLGVQLYSQHHIGKLDDDHK